MRTPSPPPRKSHHTTVCSACAADATNPAATMAALTKFKILGIAFLLLPAEWPPAAGNAANLKLNSDHRIGIRRNGHAHRVTVQGRIIGLTRRDVVRIVP